MAQSVELMHYGEAFFEHIPFLLGKVKVVKEGYSLQLTVKLLVENQPQQVVDFELAKEIMNAFGIDCDPWKGFCGNLSNGACVV